MLVIATNTLIRPWNAIYFTIASFLVGRLHLAIYVQPIDLHILYSLLNLKGHTQMRLTEAALECEVGGTISTTPWHAFAGVVLSEHYALLNRREASTVFIPVTAFPTREVLDTFLAEVAERIKRASNVAIEPYPSQRLST
ncbi:MAG: hypothetical protein H7172_06230 [Ferruginibacter sp.]|nr:hypothetical protein [Rhodoferax sp.]